MCPSAIASMGADDNRGIDLETPSWHEVLHALPAPVYTFPDSQTILFNSLRQYDTLINAWAGESNSQASILNSQYSPVLSDLEHTISQFLASVSSSIKRGIIMSTLQDCEYHIQHFTGHAYHSA